MNKLQVTLVARVLGEPRNISGSNDKGAYSFDVAEVLDQDYNKVEITLPRGFSPSKLVADERYVFECDVTADRRGYLKVAARKVEEARPVPASAPAPAQKAG